MVLRRYIDYWNLRKQLRHTPLFDAKWYLRQYADVSRSGLTPLLHYALHGVREGRNPNPYFFTRWYLETYPDVAARHDNPFLHFLAKGVGEGRNPNPLFFTRWYLQQNPDVARKGINPLLHYLERGKVERTSPNPLFDAPWYLATYFAANSSEVEPFLHYLIFGAKEGKNPNPHFDTRWYLETYPDVTTSGVNPLQHYLASETGCGTNPNPYFDTRWYLATYPHVQVSAIHPLAHYLHAGLLGETNPNPYFDTRWYLQTNPEVAKNRLDPLLHYLLFGEKEGLNPSPHFDAAWYQGHYAEVAASKLHPLHYFLQAGEAKGHNPNPYFDPAWYAATYADVAASGMHPLRHFIVHGQQEQRKPHPHLDAGRYLDEYLRWIWWFQTLSSQDRAVIQGQIAAMQRPPVISILMPVYDPPPQWLDEAIQSVRNQLYPHWELCIADDASADPAVREVLMRHATEDGRIKVIWRPENGHISRASNSALELASGEFAALLDHDDLLTEDALFWLAEAIKAHPRAGLLYSDEDKINEAGRRFGPYCKSEWNPLLFLGHNLITHLGCYRTALVRELGGFRPGYEGAQDYDLAARVAEKLDQADIVHIPRILYHWRVIPGSTAGGPGEKPYALIASEKAINEHLARQNLPAAATGIAAMGMHQIRFQLPPDPPMVSILIPTKNREDLLRACISSILSKTSYPRYEILVIDNGSGDPKTLAYLDELIRNPQIHLLRDDGPFNFSRLNNRAVTAAKGEVVVLLNNDTEVIAPEWLEAMVALAVLPQIGAVGAKLVFPDGTIQHGGVILGLGSCASHAHAGFPQEALGYFGRAQLLQMMTAVTGACLAVRKTVYEEVGGLDEHDLPVAFNDLDFCLKLRERGYWNVWTPLAVLVHHESVSRGYEVTSDKRRRYYNEMSIVKKRWPAQFYNDPAYNPNLSLNKAGDFSLARHPRIALGSLHTPPMLPSTLIRPAKGAPHLLLASAQGSDTNPPRMVVLAESLRQQGIIASYTSANRDGVYAVSPGVTGWFDGICLQGDPAGMHWFQQSVMRRLPYLADWNDAAFLESDLLGRALSEDIHLSLVHAGRVTVNSAEVLQWLEHHAFLDLAPWTHVVPDGFTFAGPCPELRQPKGLFWHHHQEDRVPEEIDLILGAINTFTEHYQLPLYCAGDFDEAMIRKVKRSVMVQFAGEEARKAFLQEGKRLIGLVPVATGGRGQTARFSDIRMAEFGGLAIPAVYSAVPAFLDSDVQTGRVVDNTYEDWLQALEDLYAGGYAAEMAKASRIREARSFDTLARERWRPALGHILMDSPVPASTLFR